MTTDKPSWSEIAFFFAACCALILVAKLDSVRRALGL